jgi:hypothetical protein
MGLQDLILIARSIVVVQSFILKKFVSWMSFNDNGYHVYRRRGASVIVVKNDVKLDN